MPKSTARFRITLLLLVLTLTTFLTIFVFSTPISHLFLPTPPRAPANPVSLARLRLLTREHRAQKLATALSHWSTGQPPAEFLEIAAACSPREAAIAIFRHLRHSLSTSGVIDIGANKGYPVTRLALAESPSWVLSVEPDNRNYLPLSRLPKHPDTVYKPVRGAVSHAVGNMDMAFHRDRDDFTCFSCLNVSRDEVTVSSIAVHTVDSLVHALQGDVALLKTDTQGHEAAVLAGAERLLTSGRVYAVLVEFDPKLLRKLHNAHAIVAHLFNAALRCVHLEFAKVPDEEQAPFFAKEITPDNVSEFWEFVKTHDKYTDLFCLRR